MRHPRRVAHFPQPAGGEPTQACFVAFHMAPDLPSGSASAAVRAFLGGRDARAQNSKVGRFGIRPASARLEGRAGRLCCRKCAPVCGLAMNERLPGARSACCRSFRRQSVQIVAAALPSASTITKEANGRAACLDACSTASIRSKSTPLLRAIVAVFDSFTVSCEQANRPSNTR